MDDKKYIKLINSSGEEQEYEIIVAFRWSETKKYYVVYTDNTKDEEGNLKVYASIYYPNDDSRLDDVETDEEWEEIERRVKALEKGAE
jgi:uncharacterized protein YrzB (UPF0473 family)